MKRINKKYLIIVFTSLVIFIVTPFAIFRFVNNDWIMGSIDSLIVVSMLTTLMLAYKSSNIQIASTILAICSVIAAIASVYGKGVANIYWIYPVTVAAYYLLSPKQAILMMLFTLGAVSPVLYYGLQTVDLIAVVSSLLLTCLIGFIFATSAKFQRFELSRLASMDPLTSVGNRRALDQKLSELLLIQKKQPFTVCLIVLDLDHFKLINDENGHSVGDQILVQVAKVIEARIRVTDSLYRFGGEEFVIVLLDLNLCSAEKLAEELRHLVENDNLLPDKPVTISLGVAEYEENESSEMWFQRADRALYNAKQNGRNRVCLAN